jgi:hypothetical protein
MATLVRKHIRISVWVTVYESVSLRGLEYEYISRLEMTVMGEDKPRLAGDSVGRQVLQS